jgi:Altronate dehydratase
VNFLVKSVVKMDEKDNVAIALHDLKKGEKIQKITLQDNIPQAHKIALCDLKKGDSVIRYGVVLGYAKR